MTASEARILSDKNKTTQEEVDNKFINLIKNSIEKDCNFGGNSIYVDNNKMTKNAEKYFLDLGYVIEFQKGLTLMDKDTYKISW